MPRSKRNRKPKAAQRSTTGTSLIETLLKPIPYSPPVVSSDTSKKKHSPWPAFCSALGTEYRESNEIHGQSGLLHPIAGLGIDEKQNRLILLSADYDPRVAALMRLDVQSSFPDMRVLIARPLALNISHVLQKNFFDDSGISASKILSFAAEVELEDENRKKGIKPEITTDWNPALGKISRSNLPLKTHIHSLVEQIFSAPLPSIRSGRSANLLELGIKYINEFMQVSSLTSDLENGICPIPTYEFTDSDWEELLSGKNIDLIQDRLKPTFSK